VSSAVCDSVNSNEFPFVLAADHGSAGGTIAGIRKSFPDKKLGVIWIDAHGDLHSPYTTPSGNIHGMPLSTALNEDNIPCKSNDVDSETISMWNQLKELHGIAPKITPENLVFIAVRDTEHQEDALMERLNIKNFKVEEVNRLGSNQVATETLQILNDCDIIYISFDVDSMDPDITSYGTGTPVKNGLLPSQVTEIFQTLIESKKVVCIEFVEVNPCLDEKINTMAETAFELLQPIVQQIKS
jgi:arginase